MSEHYNTLYNYSKYYKVNVEDLTKTYDKKVSQYIYRDLSINKHPALFFPIQQGERALRVIETYLSQNSKGVK